MIYCFDTGAFIQAWSRTYPIDSFPSVWDRIDDYVQKGIIVCPKVVLDELGGKQDDLTKWVKKRSKMFHENSIELQNTLKTVLVDVDNLYEADTDRSGGDPWVVALAKMLDATVVAEENKLKKYKTTASGEKEKKVNIHQACTTVGVKSIYLVEMIQQEKWKF